MIIAPHEVHEGNINRLQRLFPKSILLSEIDRANLSEMEVLIIDSMGKLSSVYQYGDVAFVGGGFGKGIHNLLEPAAFGLPTFFGSNFEKFEEAKQLIELKGAFSVKNSEDFIKKMSELHDEIPKGEISKQFVLDNRGATEKIISKFSFTSIP